MASNLNLHALALAYHQRLPERLWHYLNARGIPDELVHRHLLGWNGRRITIPIKGRDAKIAFFKLAKDPEDSSDSPKMLAAPAGTGAELYGWEHVLARPEQIVICEGEFDRMLLEAQDFAAVTSTVGAGNFLPEWAETLQPIPNVYICFDNDGAGRRGAERVARLISHACIVRLPEEVGDGGDVTDFFVRLGRGREDFEHLLRAAKPLPAEEKAESLVARHAKPAADSELDRLKSAVRIEDIVGRYLPLRRSGQNFIARCQFHDDHNPSFVVFPHTQSFYCFGCQQHGDVLKFLMQVERLSFPEALKALRQL
jgi:DNA primase